MRDIALTEVAFLGMRNIAIRNSTGEVVYVLTDQEHTDLLKSVAGGRKIPAAISDDWFAGNITVGGGCPHFQGFEKGFMTEGHICVDSPQIAIGYKQLLKNGRLRPSMLFINKAKVNIDKTGGITLTKTQADAWDETKTGLLQIVNGIMRVAV